MNTAPTAADLIASVTVPPAAASESSPPPVTDQAAPAGAESQPPPPTPPPSATTTPAPDENPFAGEKDAIGREFDPKKFRLKDGVPHRDSRDWFVPLGLGSKSAEKTATEDGKPGATSSLPPETATVPAPDESAEISAELSVEVAIGLIQTVLIMIGEEEGILTPLEERMLKRPLTRCLQKYELADKMTPELEAAAVVALLFQRRLKRPKTQTWFQEKLSQLRGWWIARRVARTVPDSVSV